MKKLTKRIVTLIAAAIMLIAMSIPAMAEPMAGEVPSANDKAAVTINGLAEGTTVKLYRIVKPVYTENGLEKFEADNGVSIADTETWKPTSDEITAIAAGSLTEYSQTPAYNVSALSGGTITVSDLQAGEYLVIAKDATGKTVYNPMIVSVFYEVKDGDQVVTGGSVSAKDNWTLTTENAFAKSTTPETKKEIVEPGSGNDKGDDTAIGDTINFKVTSLIPSYSSEYTTVTFKMTDTMEAGLDYVGNMIVKVGGEEVAATNYTITENKTAGGGYVIVFNSDYLKSLASANDAGRTVELTYDAKLNANAKTNLDSNNNTVTVEYSNDPQDTDSTNKETDKTRNYTFEIDGKAFGNAGKNNKDVYKKGEEVVTDYEYHQYGLDGAEFTLYTDEACTQVLKVNGADMVTTTTGEGQMNFKGLDAGTYYLKETKAPAGYSLSTTVHKVTISATYYDADDAENGIEKGMLKDYTIAFEEVGNAGHSSSKSYEAVYNNDGSLNTTEVNIHDNSEGYDIANTKIPGLPSTGGAGTYMLTIFGVALFFVMLGLIIRDKKSRA